MSNNTTANSIFSDINLTGILCVNDLNDRENETRSMGNQPDGSILELSKSIVKQGLLQPICVYPIIDERYQYKIIYGKRRIKAAIIAGLTTIRAEVLEHPTPLDISLRIIDENKRRKDLTETDDATLHIKAIPLFFDDLPDNYLELGDTEKLKNGLLKLSKYVALEVSRKRNTNKTFEPEDVKLYKGFASYFESMQISLTTLRRKASLIGLHDEIRILLDAGLISSNGAGKMQKIFKKNAEIFKILIMELNKEGVQKKAALRAIELAYARITPDQISKVENGQKRVSTAIKKFKKLKKIPEQKVEAFEKLVSKIEILLTGETSDKT